MTEATQEAKAVRQLSVIVGLLVIFYCCNRILFFTLDIFHSLFVYAFYVISFFAVGPVLRLRPRARLLILILLVPLLLFGGSSLGQGNLGRTERTQSIQTVQQGSSTVQLQRYENGGALGVHGLNIEQSRLIIPGLYLARSIDFLESAKEGTLSIEGRYLVRVHAAGNYYNNNSKIDRTYRLKPWVYF